mgnify:FL=1
MEELPLDKVSLRHEDRKRKPSLSNSMWGSFLSFYFQREDGKMVEMVMEVVMLETVIAGMVTIEVKEVDKCSFFSSIPDIPILVAQVHVWTAQLLRQHEVLTLDLSRPVIASHNNDSG